MSRSFAAGTARFHHEDTKPRRYGAPGTRSFVASCLRGDEASRCACRRDARGEALAVRCAQYSAMAVRPRTLANSVLKKPNRSRHQAVACGRHPQLCSANGNSWESPVPARAGPASRAMTKPQRPCVRDWANLCQAAGIRYRGTAMRWPRACPVTGRAGLGAPGNAGGPAQAA